MISADIIQKIRSLELKTRKSLSGQLTGDYRTILKGSGFEFDQLRDYVPGDDVRFIDWKSSARTGKLLVRQYLEDRNRNVIIAVDCSQSTFYGTGDELKSDAIRQVAGMLAFWGFYAKDVVGLTLFTTTVEKMLPCAGSRGHIIRLLSTLYGFEPRDKRTDMNACLRGLLQKINKRVVLCIISDFLDEIDPKLLRELSKRHEVLAFRCIDEREDAMIPAGMLTFCDSETGQKVLYNTQDQSEFGMNDALRSFHEKQESAFKTASLDLMTFSPSGNYFEEIARFLQQRSQMYRGI